MSLNTTEREIHSSIERQTCPEVWAGEPDGTVYNLRDDAVEIGVAIGQAGAAADIVLGMLRGGSTIRDILDGVAMAMAETETTVRHPRIGHLGIAALKIAS
jgi:hypothetical protein